MIAQGSPLILVRLQAPLPNYLKEDNMTGEELAKQIEESGIIEEELKSEGWGRICGALPEDLADGMKKKNTARVKIPDELNLGKWVVMEYGYKSYIPKDNEYSLAETSEKIDEKKDEIPENWFDS